ncbi:kinase-like domain-containing protein [Gigaspora rosea]|uniref:Kinase-like domain-containing protein n=1 Tax=Gigaspora rosea TaxID=44941 RepID=A0A397VA71_9GLOM|nr:kinase-like domain-containing protein [Gigaspora rosea]
MRWKKKLSLLICIASDLQIIHSQDLIHRDLHSGNILLNDLNHAYIADLGLSTTVNIASTSKSDGIYGVLPYIDPEVFDSQLYTQKSDIYSFGIIMWEILYGKPVVFKPVDFNTGLQLQIYNGLRPHILEGTALCYTDLMKKCWSKEPVERPSAVEIHDIFTKWLNDQNILLELSKSDKKIQSIENEQVPVYDHESYTSQLISWNDIRCCIGNIFCFFN